MELGDPDRVPVLIVGGGATGLTLSALLSRYGVRSLLVERNPSTCDHPQAHVINRRSMEIFRQMGLASEIQRHALPAPAMSYVRWVTDLGGAELAVLNLSPETERIEAFMSASPAMPASCGQDRLEPLLAALAAKGPGSTLFGTEMVNLEATGDGVAATLLGPDGERTVNADWVVACDGAASPTRKIVGIPMEGPEALAHVVGIYFHADLSEIVENRPAVLYWAISEDASGTFIAIDGRERWVFHAAWDTDQLSLESYTEQRCHQILQRALGSELSRKTEIEIRSIRPWTMSAQVAERYREGRVLLVGDAAHRFPPTGGFGMNTGIQDAHNLAWKLAAVIEGSAGSTLLDSYESERLPVGRENCAWSARNAAGLASVNGPGAVHQAARLARGDVSVEELAREIQQVADREVGHFSALGRDIGFHYESGALFPDGSEPPHLEDPDRDYVPSARPGARAPHHGLVRAGELISTLDLMSHQWTLLAGATRAEAWRTAAASSGFPIQFVGVASGLDSSIDDNAEIRDPSGSFTSLYGINEGAVLVRPDGHVAWRAHDFVENAADELRRVLAKILRKEPPTFDHNQRK